jgi:hypothetical protein
MVVTDSAAETAGHLQLRDLLQRVSLADYDLSRPVAEMTALAMLLSHVSAYRRRW